MEVENCFEHMPAQPVIGSHMATAHTQTNWNGIVGMIGIRVLPVIAMDTIRIYPDFDKKGILIYADMLQNTGILQSVCWEISVTGGVKKEVHRVIPPGKTKVLLEYELGNEYLTWDEFKPDRYELNLSLRTKFGSQERKVDFGMRKFQVSPDSRHFMINGKVIFVRSEANCAVFPKTGYAPMEEEEWEKLFTTYKSYGINYVRFHSWCPPDAAFRVADRLGIYMQPELCEWTFETFDTDEDYRYYTREAKSIDKAYGNHPSYVALTWGNELRSHKRERMSELCRYMRQIAPDRLYAEGSNVWYGEKGVNPECDFVMAQANYKDKWRGAYAGNHGFINDAPPNTLSDYNEVLKDIPIPVISFEVGQFQVYPDYNEIKKYTGNLQPENLRTFKEDLDRHGMAGYDSKFQEATGQLSRLCYREEIEAALRSDKLAGISLLGIQDFSGQGTALVGMIDAFGESKKFSNPAVFRQFFNCIVPLLKIGKRTFRQKEKIQAEVVIANYGESGLKKPVSICVTDAAGRAVYKEVISSCSVEQGKVECIGTLNFIPGLDTDASYKLKIKIQVEGTDYINEYELWIYPEVDKKELDRSCIVTAFDESVRERLEKGERLILLPKLTQSSLPVSVKSSFMSDFWCWIMFKKRDQHGTMGMLIETEHKLFEKMQVDEYTNYPWWHMLKNSRSVILDDTGIQPIIRMVDNIHRNHSMGLLFEVKCGNGSLLISSLNILPNLEQPEAVWMLHCMLNYVKSGDMNPVQEVSFQKFCLMFPNHKELVLDYEDKPFASINDHKMYAPIKKQENKPGAAYWDTTGSRTEDEKFYGILFERTHYVDMVQINLVTESSHDDKSGFDLPELIEVEYLDGDTWKPVHVIYRSFLTEGKENKIYFKQTEMQGIKILLKKDKKNEVYISAETVYKNQPYAIAELKFFGI
ncbi:hypothetical protein Ana3638_01420 [Anaerocolumna sedimenticola]|uniref:beta-galactosidase n=1 Tax=Anaerocolumna sedimenticola TaxID=2696063 RepID=A0A6P1THP8_9FIRM|nr:hypothetical protein [Anaerocolumna sedimenticola]QHQ59622.1 hypothetical protein Ana3638_01420 [Anaerocolumna sedimenticola]